MITCRELIDFLDDYISDEMDARHGREVDGHLAVCPDCLRYIDQYRKTIELGRAALLDDNSPAPKDVPEGLIKAVLAARSRGE